VTEVQAKKRSTETYWKSERNKCFGKVQSESNFIEQDSDAKITAEVGYPLEKFPV
jgi:hypothetical protein